jgi:ribose transport system substrate-binding protein
MIPRMIGHTTKFRPGALLMLFASVTLAGETPRPTGELAEAEARVSAWDGPVIGPQGVSGKTIVYIAGDLRNGGILGVAGGLREAAKALGWSVKVIDLRGGGTDASAKAVADAIERKADGVILGGFDAHEHAASLRPLSEKKIPVLSWHAAPAPGPVEGTPVRLNVSTEPIKVARAAALSVAATRRDGRAGVVIFTDTRFGIAKAKSDAMAAVVRGSEGCQLLEVCDAPLDSAAKNMPELTRRLLAKHGAKWTHALAINDLYFDHATPVFAVAGLPPDSGVDCISAGDGSASAYVRIQAGLYQTATVAEPLNLQGWQLADELNRIFAGAAPSGYITPVHLVNAGNIGHDGGPQRRFDPDNGYREAYKKIWRR